MLRITVDNYQIPSVVYCFGAFCQIVKYPVSVTYLCSQVMGDLRDHCKRMKKNFKKRKEKKRVYWLLN